MGASPFHVYGEGADLQAAFARAHEQTGFEDGYTYSGTLSSKPGAVRIGTAPLPMQAATLEADRLMAADDRRVMDKWGPAGALPVTDATVRTRTRKVTVASTARNEWEAREQIVAAVDLAPNEVIDRIDVTSMPELTYTVTATTTAGPSVTRYRIRGVDGDYATQAEARRAMIAMLKGPHCYRDTLAVEAVRVRQGGEALVVATRSPRPRRIRATVSIITPDPTAPIAGWLFFGLAPS